jgi:RNA polymerase sigma-70 factor (ECF subfamily)
MVLTLNQAMTEEFEQIVGDYQHKIFRLCVALLGDRDDALEAAQDVLVRVWKGLPGFRRESSLSTWIYTITRNACWSALRRRQIEASSLEDPASHREVARRAAADWALAPSPDAAALLESLPAKYRQVASLFYMQEKSYDEVARMLDLPVGTVKTYLFRARKSLAEELVRRRVRKGEA